MIFNAERVGGLVDEPVRTWLPSPAMGRLLKLGFGSSVVLNSGFGALTLLLGGHTAPALLRSGVSSKYTLEPDVALVEVFCGMGKQCGSLPEQRNKFVLVILLVKYLEVKCLPCPV